MAPVTSVKNLKRVAGGKAIAEKNRQEREEQKKKLVEADAIIAKDQLRKAKEVARRAEEAVKAPPVEVPEAKTPSADSQTPAAKTPSADSQTLTTTQWLSVISIIISVVGIYYKREEIKKVLTEKTQPKAPTPPPVDFSPPPVKTQKKREYLDG